MTDYKGSSDPEIKELATEQPWEQEERDFEDDFEHNPEFQKSADWEPIKCEFLTGAAGSGKTYEILRRIKEDPKYGVIAATTGIAAINLNTTTINALLKYFDTASLQESFLRGFLGFRMRQLREAEGMKRIVIDEVSMMDAAQLDIIYQAAAQANVDLVAVGDFLQLPPVKAKWAFQADCWPDFEKNTTRLSKVWRQSEGWFLDAINHTRVGRGQEAAELLKKNGVVFANAVDINFKGTTIKAKNEEVDRHNIACQLKVQGKPCVVRSSRWGKPRGEWKLIPDVLRLKIGDYVMILANDSPNFAYCNGDCGYIRNYVEERGTPTRVALDRFGIIPASDPGEYFEVELVRTGQIVKIGAIIRAVTQTENPEGFNKKDGPFSGEMWRKRVAQRSTYFCNDKNYYRFYGKWITGEIEYFPLRLAYASTVHKSQGLSLDNVQIDIRNQFMSTPAMMYVSLSRARTAQGLRIVGTPEDFVRRVRTDEAVARYL